MANNFSRQVQYDGKTVLAVIIKELRKDGMYYEVNIKGFARFYMSWSALERYDAQNQDHLNLPYELVLAVSDAIESAERKSRS